MSDARNRSWEWKIVFFCLPASLCSAHAFGDLMFGEPQYYGSDSAFRVAAGDLNGDGSVDLIAGDQNSVYRFFNSGDGTFAAPVQVASNETLGLASEDLDHDGDLEIVIGAGSVNAAVVLLNSGAGSFPFQSTWSVGAPPTGLLTIQDFNGDDHLDLVLATVGLAGEGSQMAVLFNNGDATFADAVLHPTGGGYPDSTSSGDVDGDGDYDVAVRVGSFQSPTGFSGWSLFRNDGEGAFALPTLTPLEGSGNGILADYDGDDDLDFAVLQNLDPHQISIFLNDGSGMFAPIESYVIGNGGFVTSADLDGDGDVDLMTSNQTDQELQILLNNGDATFVDGPHVNVGHDANQAVIADFNNDGALDIAVTVGGTNVTLAVLLNTGGLGCVADVDGNGTVDVEDLLAVLALWGPCTACPADITGDGVVGVDDMLAVLADWGPCG